MVGLSRTKWASIDDQGFLYLASRAEEGMSSNSVKLFPCELRRALKEAIALGMLPSYTTVLLYRPKNIDSKTLCMIYLLAFNS